MRGLPALRACWTTILGVVAIINGPSVERRLRSCGSASARRDRVTNISRQDRAMHHEPTPYLSCCYVTCPCYIEYRVLCKSRPLCTWCNRGWLDGCNSPMLLKETWIAQRECRRSGILMIRNMKRVLTRLNSKTDLPAWSACKDHRLIGNDSSWYPTRYCAHVETWHENKHRTARLSSVLIYFFLQFSCKKQVSLSDLAPRMRESFLHRKWNSMKMSIVDDATWNTANPRNYRACACWILSKETFTLLEFGMFTLKTYAKPS